MLDIHNERITQPAYHLRHPYHLALRHPTHKKTLKHFLEDRGNLATLCFFLSLACIYWLKITHAQ
ncbi:hypothetical protein [Ferrovum sp.]|uniref:hypothetical protein n=1 Tax=Ferrovum sp. TaxID=2609467 RepID=UPI0013BCD76E|nr:hypothetical protein [Ferrovum sp.]NDU88397.1 hypothetical protein [Ferrovum sp.]